MRTTSILVFTAILAVGASTWFFLHNAAPATNGGSLMPPSSRYVDAGPSGWTCTLRTGSDGCNEEGGCSYEVGSSVSCSGSEKVITGGCGGGGLGTMRANRPSGQGWYCTYSSASDIYAYANCCT